MIFVGDFIQDEKGMRVNFIHNMPFDEKYGFGKTEQELLQIGALVDSIPGPQQIEGKTAVLYYNAQTNSVYYEYIDKPLSDQGRIAQIEAQNAQMLLVLVEKGLM